MEMFCRRLGLLLSFDNSVLSRLSFEGDFRFIPVISTQHHNYQLCYESLAEERTHNMKHHLS
jgi:hypothetical protein